MSKVELIVNSKSRGKYNVTLRNVPGESKADIMKLAIANVSRFENVPERYIRVKKVEAV
ncbi:MAG: hypothetical protein H6Q72_4747 [Firmicutes bacterium]|nr:hypothetical protein [Bacillota bacterium]